MRVVGLVLLVAWAVGVASAQTAAKRKEPQIGYLYPAGGQQGTTFYVLAGGQRLRNASDVYVSGDGVRATVVRALPVMRMLTREQLRAARRRLEELRKNPQAAESTAGVESVASQPTTSPGDAAELDVNTLSLRELEYLAAFAQSGDKKQLNAQIADVVLVEVVIGPKAAVGDRELRLGSPGGLTNPLRFQVGRRPEICEQEAVGRLAAATPELKPPFLINGQIMPGDVDRFRFGAQGGQRLVLEVQARSLIPYLADAVPGWFQATLALYDAGGHELAFADDYRFNPDPVLLFEVPEDGAYELEIRDALYRGREDFVYRIAVGESPFVTQVFPLGGRAGTLRGAAIAGWNLPGDRLRLDLKAGPERIRRMSAQRGGWRSNDVVYAVDSLPEGLETEPNDDTEHAQVAKLPRIINGRIGQPGDVDVFQFSGRVGDEIVAEVYARRLNSPLDARLTLTDADGQVVGVNDDCEATATGLLTHGADSYLRVKLPHGGAFAVQLADAQQHGGEEYGYRLRIGPPQPDFELRLTPASISVPPGRVVPFRVHVLRTDGFDGEIELALEDAPSGFALAGERIPAGVDSIRLTLTAPRERPEEPVALRLSGRAEIRGQNVIRPVVPAEDMMQAFSYRHLVPAQELLVAVTKGRPPAAGLAVASTLPVRIPAGGTAEVRFTLPARGAAAELQAVLSEPPKGVVLQSAISVSGSLVLVLRADEDAVQPGLRDNLIVEVFTETARPQDGKRAEKQGQRVSVGFLPAIPIEIVPR